MKKSCDTIQDRNKTENEERGVQRSEWTWRVEYLVPSVQAQHGTKFCLLLAVQKFSENVAHIFIGVYMRDSIGVSMKNLMEKRNADALSFFEVA